jgi:hypothetical protein
MPSLKTQLVMDSQPFDDALVRARAAAAAAGQSIQKSLTLKISQMQDSIARMPQGAARNAAEEKLQATKMRLAVETQRSITAMTIAENERRVAAELAMTRAAAAAKAASLAKMSTIARAGGVGMRGGDSHAGGVSGILSETLVVLREMGRGNWSRIPGSITIIAQRMGILGQVIKSSAAEAVTFAAKQNVLAASSARFALAEEAKARAVYDSALAETGDAAAATRLAAGNNAIAASALRAAEAEAVKAEAAVAAAETATAAATVSIGPIGWIAAALIALGTATYFVVRQYHHPLATEQRNLNALMDRGATAYHDQADALDHAADSARDLAKWLAELNEHQQSLADNSQKAADGIREQAAAHKELRDAQKANALAQVDLDEKSGKISKPEATRRRADIDKQSLIGDAKAKLDELNAVVDQTEKDWFKARAVKSAAEAAVKTAESNLNQSPEALARQNQLKTDEDKFNQAKALVAKLEENAKTKGLKDDYVQDVEVGGVKYGVSLNKARTDAETLRGRVQDDKDNALPAQTALDTAKKNLQTATTSFNQIDQANQTAVHAANANAQTAPGILATKLDTENKKEQADLLGDRKQIRTSLNSDQRIGAYSAGGSSHLSKIEQHLASLDRKTKAQPVHPPVGRERTRYGGMYS